MNKIYVVGTPIGNLEDITFRAIRILSEVDCILCEDTRVTKNLLNKYQIKTSTFSYPSDNLATNSKVDQILEMIKKGKDLALVSDAGTPTISDPGSILISKIRDNFPEIEIITIPGPSALVSALSISGLSISEFTFLGFLPHKKGRETLFKEIAIAERTMVFYESPHRIIKSLESLKKFSPDKKVVIARELTKLFEQTISGNPESILQYFKLNSDKIRGEFVVMVAK